ncbi:6068_t:CDS:1 [Ambispora gerdemannii]|uniref:6068_t:CDS:1 n=1 Tax=Ambispora gerdemannii TaxID=144530 RepID=A0A9N9BW85_9GLOM|nr:6068_t:CDS:1 [Ambispora gerdemannii]
MVKSLEGKRDFPSSNSNNAILEKIDVTLPMNDALISILTKTPKKPLNSFFLFRKAYSHTLTSKHFRLSASEVSQRASAIWKAKSEPARQEFKKLADQIRENALTEICLPSSANQLKNKYKWRHMTQDPQNYKRSYNKRQFEKPLKPLKPTSAGLIQNQSHPYTDFFVEQAIEDHVNFVPSDIDFHPTHQLFTGFSNFNQPSFPPIPFNSDVFALFKYNVI